MASNPVPPEQAVERAMVAIRRRQARRALARRAQAAGDLPVRPAVTELLDTVEAAAAGGRQVTVTDLAALLSVDQPRASKLAGLAVADGLLARVADQRDGRRSSLELTPAGAAYLATVHRYRQTQFAAAMHGWTDHQRAVFAGLLTQFVAALDAAEHPGPPGPLSSAGSEWDKTAGG